MVNLNDNTMVLPSSEIVDSIAERAARPCLIEVVGTQVGRTIILRRGKMSFGRSADCDVVLDDFGSSRLHARIHDTDDGPILTDLGSTNGTFVNGERVESRLLRDGDRVQIGRATLFKFTRQDAIEQQFQRTLYESATQDALTGLYNRKYFLDRLKADFNHAKRHARALGVAILDIDFFKRVNDTHGHLAGDHVLRQLAGVLSSACRTEDLVARFGGEEFALIYRDADAAQVTISGERLRRMVEKTPFQFEDQPIAVTVSIGLATLDLQTGGADVDLVRAADAFLYIAKRNGRNRIESPLTSREEQLVVDG